MLIPKSLQVYYAIFYSHLNYGCNIWGFTSEENLKKIEILQRKCLRIITFSDFRSHANPLFRDLKVLKVRDIIKLQQLQLLYDFLNKSLPADLKSLFTLNSHIHRYQLRTLFHIPKINSSTYGNKSIKFHCPDLWNNLFRNGIAIDEVKKHNVSFNQIKNSHQFKRVLKKHFFFTYSLV